MSQHIVWSCGAARRDRIICITQLDDGRYELELEDVAACAVLAPEDGVEVLRQLRGPTADLERVTDAAVRFGQALAEHPKSAAQAFAENAGREVVRRGQPLPGGFFAESEGCAPAAAPAGRIFTAPDGAQVGSWSGSRSDVDGPVTLEVSVSPVDGGTWSGGGPPQPVFRMRVDAPKQHWTVCLPHGAARGLIRELQSYVDIHDTHG